MCFRSLFSDDDPWKDGSNVHGSLALIGRGDIFCLHWACVMCLRKIAFMAGSFFRVEKHWPPSRVVLRQLGFNLLLWTQGNNGTIVGVFGIGINRFLWQKEGGQETSVRSPMGWKERSRSRHNKLEAQANTTLKRSQQKRAQTGVPDILNFAKALFFLGLLPPV